jgi:hypothetical protein
MPDDMMDRIRWSTADLEEMSWHDVNVHAFAYLSEAYEIAFDIDYMVRWVSPAAGETHYSFWIAPATLVFESVHELRFDLESQGGLTVFGVTREDERPTREGFAGPPVDWLWVIDCLEGAIQFRSTRFRQTLRRSPELRGTQRLGLAERGGISFGE